MPAGLKYVIDGIFFIIHQIYHFHLRDPGSIPGIGKLEFGVTLSNGPVVRIRDFELCNRSSNLRRARIS